MKEVSTVDIRRLYLPPANSHKGQNGRLLVIGGSRLFHAAGLWACEIASKIVDMVYYASVPLNLRLMEELKIKGLFRNGIVVPRGELESYLQEADCVLIGPGMVRRSQKSKACLAVRRVKSQKYKLKVKNIKEIERIKDEGGQTRVLVEYLLKKYPKKRWVIDGGALQEMEEGWIPRNSILTPHQGECKRLFNKFDRSHKTDGEGILQRVKEKVKKYHCVILLKGREDLICGAGNMEGGRWRIECRRVRGGNAGMTKGGTGDVLAGLTAAFYCKNEAFLSALAASYFNKKAGESLFEKQGFFFNASDLVSEVPEVMKDFNLFDKWPLAI